MIELDSHEKKETYHCLANWAILADWAIVSDTIDHKWIIQWCEEQGIDAEFVGMWTITSGKNGYSLWRVKDPSQRTAFSLRWM